VSRLGLDEVDWRIMRELQRDGRQNFRELGKTIGFTGLGAKKRVDKLVDQKILEVSARINSEALNIHLAMLFLEMESGEAMQAILERFKDCPRVINFFTTLGGYNLVALVMAEDKGVLECESMEKCSLRSAKGIRRSEFSPIRSVHYSPFLNIRLPTVVKEGQAPCGADCLSCRGFQSMRCLGCPASEHYRGPLRRPTVEEET
jgi:DNA-binding Lrp family transcriptional regulator